MIRKSREKIMTGPSEREYKEKLDKILEKTSKTTRDIRDKFTQIEKVKAEALKKTEELKQNADREIEKTIIEITRSRDLANESKERLEKEITKLKHKIQDTYNDLKKRVSETIIPAPPPAETPS